ncbi:MAG: hypothetical protein ACR2P6_07205, partial [Gammaproteobacteria bacterium]
MSLSRWLNKIAAIDKGIAVVTLLAMTSTSAAWAEDNELFTSDFAGLNEEQKVFASRALDFLSRINDMYFGRIDQMNGGSEKTSRARSTEYA